MTSRRRAREIALQVLYSVDANPELDPAQALALHLGQFGEEEGERSEPVDEAFAESLVREVSERRAEIDEAIAQVSRHWRIERMARVDRTILRMALFELKHRDDIPARVSINEAIELAKRFGAEDAPAFVNGLLDSAVTTLGISK